MNIGFMSNHFRGLQRRIWSRSTPFQVVPWHVGNPTHRGGRVPNGSTRSLGCAAQKILSDFKPNIRTYPRPALTKSPKQRPSRAFVVLHSPRNQQQTDAPVFWYMHVLACSQQGSQTFRLHLVAVDPPAKSSTFWGLSGKPNLISTKKLKSKDPLPDRSDSFVKFKPFLRPKRCCAKLLSARACHMAMATTASSGSFHWKEGSQMPR